MADEAEEEEEEEEKELNGKLGRKRNKACFTHPGQKLPLPPAKSAPPKGGPGKVRVRPKVRRPKIETGEGMEETKLELKFKEQVKELKRSKDHAKELPRERGTEE